MKKIRNAEGKQMDFRVMAVGDVTGAGGLRCLKKHLRPLKKLYCIDFVL